MNKIIEFTGEFAFLSNFALMDEGEITVEHQFQAAKMASLEDSAKIINCKTPGQAKRLARKYPMRSDWEETKVSIMKLLVRRKFRNNKELGKKLLETGDAILEEGNNWNDNFWGVCPPGSPNGQNMLGKILMEVRSELKPA